MQPTLTASCFFDALCADFDAKDRQLVEGSPTFVLDEGRH
jgi:hypothetical protein